jgi:predicted porin
MKKTLIALAAVAATGAAFAQSSVTLFGRLDASVASVNVETNGVKQYPATKNGIDSSNMNTQFWGLRGTEDLGGGLKANFMLQSNFQIDTGAASANFFDREAWVGLSGGFGAVRLGRQYSAYDVFYGAVNHTFNSNINVTGDVFGNGVAAYDTRVSNSIVYFMPTISGFNASIAYGFGEDKTATTSATSHTSLQVHYAKGPILVGAAVQRKTLAGNIDRDHNIFGGSYDLGVAKLTGSYQTSKQASTKDKEYQVGVSAPVGPVTLAFGYADSESKTGATTLNSDGYALLGTYNLSKRTTVYVGYESTDLQTNRTTKTERTNLAFGVRHTF